MTNELNEDNVEDVSVEKVLKLLNVLGPEHSLTVLGEVVSRYFLHHYHAPLEMLSVFTSDVAQAIINTLADEAAARGEGNDSKHQ